MTQLPEILTVPDVQEYLQIGRRQAYALCTDPDFPSIRIGKSIRIPKKAFFKWLAIDKEEPVVQDQASTQRVEVEFEVVVMTEQVVLKFTNMNLTDVSEGKLKFSIHT